MDPMELPYAEGVRLLTVLHHAQGGGVFVQDGDVGFISCNIYEITADYVRLLL